VIARLAPQKNHKNLFNALKLLPENLKSKSHCLVIGSGELDNQLRSEVHRLGLRERVSFLGERADVPTILNAIDLLVLPSHWECLPIVILEALASECPVVATSVGGVPEILDEVGWPLVCPGDPKDLARAMSYVLQMPPEKRNRITKAGRKIVLEKFSREVSVIQIERLYHSLLASLTKSNNNPYGVQ
jgi:glycosyltransferase involved in cell wall biosynthesis